MTLYDELKNLIEALRARGVDYALCGGLAMAAHGWPRATLDVDLIVSEKDFPAARDVARGLGFTIEVPEFAVAGGKIRIRRLIKAQGEDAIPLDLLLLDESLRSVAESRVDLPTAFGPIRVLTREALARMKELRGSGTDQDDIRRLRGEEP